MFPVAVLAFALITVAAFALFPSATVSAAPGDIPYIDENGTTQYMNESDLTILEQANFPFNGRLYGGWYLVRGTISVTTSFTANQIYLDAGSDVHLILEDGCDLSVVATSNYAGFSVPLGSSLTIYAQSESDAVMGKLSATGGNNGPGIGTGLGDGVNVGTITINGGIVEARSVQFAAGIGTYGQNNGSVIINGGKVTASGGDSAAGIGSGYGNNYYGSVVITGGTVMATAGTGSAGIGSGNSWLFGGSVVITGGTVTAVGAGIGAGIGSGGGGEYNGSVSITGGTVNMKAGGLEGAGIGSGQGGDYNGSVTITGGMVMDQNDSSYGAGIGSGQGGDYNGSVAISGGTVKVISFASTHAGIGAGTSSSWGYGTYGVGAAIVISGGSVYGSNAFNVIVNANIPNGATNGPANGDAAVNPVTATLSPPLADTAIIGGMVSSAGYYGFDDIRTDGDGKVHLWLPVAVGTEIVLTADGLATYDVTGNVNTGANSFTLTVSGTHTAAPYMMAGGKTKICYDPVEIISTMTTLDDTGPSNGWYVAKGAVNLGSWNTLYVSGDVHLILEDGCMLTVTGGDDGGINVTGTDSLTIYAQSTDDGTMGKLMSSSNNGAGIGGAYFAGTGGAGGSVTINGGTVTAESYYGAGIGG
ncbi:MAG: hypothetical protein FWH47_02890, partial [Methanomassiliicoccaceae archaeon]|nr:hypothetical protein [Methanomassiliicoccaceae archaeon]